jgi:hypothetical protein
MRSKCECDIGEHLNSSTHNELYCVKFLNSAYKQFFSPIESIDTCVNISRSRYVPPYLFLRTFNLQSHNVVINFHLHSSMILSRSDPTSIEYTDSRSFPDFTHFSIGVFSENVFRSSPTNFTFLYFFRALICFESAS